ncbi:YELLOW STRIPE like 6 [Actinidia rufa]|uniref:YELLOW STRIPE like 6 n=1 Tax=Actinidia rufa TaxID=165716 RepID=A0A7J0E9N6_9ERIC|nr:YELLOW STRIPE like 6 [Actinidia rufa]
MEASEPLLLGEPEKIGDHESEPIPEWKEQITNERAGGERCVGDALLYHHSQAESHRRHDRVPQRRRRIVRVLPRQVVDGASVQIRVFATTVHQAREHRHSDLRRRLLWHRLQCHITVLM